MITGANAFRGTALGRATVDHGVGCRLHSILGLGQSAAWCDIAVILSCAGLWWGSLFADFSQAVSSLAAGILWLRRRWLATRDGTFSVGEPNICGCACTFGSGCSPVFHLALPPGPPLGCANWVTTAALSPCKPPLLRHFSSPRGSCRGLQI